MLLRALSPSLLSAALMALVFCTPAPSQATPPRALSVEDVLFGENATHLFVVRTVSDNLETHMTELTDTLLIAINLQNGLEEKAWPVQRTLESGDVFTRAPEDRIRTLSIADQINPFDLLAKENARPLLDSAAKTVTDARLQKWYSKDSYAIGRWIGTPEFELSFSRLKASIETSFQMIRTTLPAYSEGYDPLTDTAFSNFEKCQTTRLFLTRPQPADRLRVFTKLRCFDQENAIWSWLYMAVPEVGE